MLMMGMVTVMLSSQDVTDDGRGEDVGGDDGDDDVDAEGNACDGDNYDDNDGVDIDDGDGGGSYGCEDHDDGDDDVCGRVFMIEMMM